MKSALSVSVGIPAYNEEANIKNLLGSVLSQKGDNFTLKEIIVFSDGSSDRTVEIANRIGDSRIKVIDNKTRAGQANGQNEIIRQSTGDVTVLLNADTLLGDDSVLSELVKPFQGDEKVGLVCPRFQPLPPRTLFERILEFSIQFKDDMFKNWNSGNNIYMCVGRARAFSREFLGHLKWPTASSEDAYSYLACLDAGKTFVYLDRPFVLYKLPDNFKDHMKQSTRFMSGPELMVKYFPKDLVDRNYSLPRDIVMSSALKYLAKNPFYMAMYLGVLLLSKASSLFKKNDSSLWSISASSKKLS